MLLNQVKVAAVLLCTGIGGGYWAPGMQPAARAGQTAERFRTGDRPDA